MNFETFYAGSPIAYTGSDNMIYIATVKADKDFPSIRKCIITRQDGNIIDVRGAKYPKGYVVGHGEFTARNMHNEAVQYMVAP